MKTKDGYTIRDGEPATVLAALADAYADGIQGRGKQLEQTEWCVTLDVATEHKVTVKAKDFDDAVEAATLNAREQHPNASLISWITCVESDPRARERRLEEALRRISEEEDGWAAEVAQKALDYAP